MRNTIRQLFIVVLLAAFSKSCFAAGTPLLTPEGARPIEDVRVGSLVLSRDEHGPDGPVQARRSLLTFQSFSPILGSAGSARVLSCFPWALRGLNMADAHSLY
jgi:Hint domain